MKVYQVHWSAPDEGNCLHWAASKAEAVRVARDAIEEGPSYSMADFTIKAVDVPTSKRELLPWLNANFNRDNG